MKNIYIWIMYCMSKSCRENILIHTLVLENVVVTRCTFIYIWKGKLFLKKNILCGGNGTTIGQKRLMKRLDCIAILFISPTTLTENVKRKAWLCPLPGSKACDISDYGEEQRYSIYGAWQFIKWMRALEYRQLKQHMPKGNECLSRNDRCLRRKRHT